MRAVVLTGTQTLQVREAPTPEISDGEVLLRSRADSICGTDMRIYRSGHTKLPANTPRILGHEMAGEVVPASAQALAYIRLLYDVEDDAENVSSAEQARIRHERAAPILVQFRSWLLSQQTATGGPVLPKSPMGQAITYALNQWAALTVYLLDGELRIDNNTAENQQRQIAFGRKNWLFCGSDNGGKTAAILFSIIATCQRHEVDPFDYLTDVLTRIAEIPISRLAELLPDRWKAARAAAAAAPAST